MRAKSSEVSEQVKVAGRLKRGKREEPVEMAGSVDGVDTVESEGFLVVGCLAVRQRISGARRLPFSPRGDLFGPERTYTGSRRLVHGASNGVVRHGASFPGGRVLALATFEKSTLRDRSTVTSRSCCSYKFHGGEIVRQGRDLYHRASPIASSRFEPSRRTRRSRSRFTSNEPNPAGITIVRTTAR